MMTISDCVMIIITIMIMMMMTIIIQVVLIIRDLSQISRGEGGGGWEF